MRTPRLRQEWREIRASRPGRRFADRYERRRRLDPAGAAWARLLRFTLALAALFAGVVLILIRAPAVPWFLLAAALLASESRRVARALDAVELRLRAGTSWVQRRWRGLSRAGKTAVTGLGAMGAAAALSGALQIWPK